ncbi:MAG: TetR/AcrR family transcriptional regulator [Pseudomonadota bacterium]|nr:TetR/AcrR family transcriptional regulator [Pseudomonadota bacterium]
MSTASSASRTTREQIVDAADQLFYEQGFDSTSFADIAAAVNLSRGNFYYHFKTKDDLLEAVIEQRLRNTQALLQQWEQQGTQPQDRIRCFIHILIANQARILLYGCPVGTLTTELAKLNHHALDQANAVFTLFRTWLRQQFQAMGRKQDADELAMHVLGRSQGVATLASAFQDEKFLKQEVKRLNQWLQQCVDDAKQ